MTNHLTSWQVPFKRHSIKENAHPLVRFLFSAMNDKRMSKKTISVLSGVEYSSFAMWQSGKNLPHLGNLEAALGALGYQLVTAPCCRPSADQEKSTGI